MFDYALFCYFQLQNVRALKIMLLTIFIFYILIFDFVCALSLIKCKIMKVVVKSV